MEERKTLTLAVWVQFPAGLFNSGIVRRGEKQSHDCLSAVFTNHGIISMEVML